MELIQGPDENTYWAGLAVHASVLDGIELRTFCYTSLPFVSKVSVLLASDLKKQYMQST